LAPFSRIIASIQAFFFLWVASAGAVERIPAIVSILPQKYFVQQIGKDRVTIQVMIQPRADLHTDEPKPSQMVAIAKAKLYFAIGIQLEKAHLDKMVAMNPTLRVVRTDRDIAKIPMPPHFHDRQGDHATDKGHQHAMERRGLDPHIGLSPSLVKVRARAVLGAREEIDPAHGRQYQANFQPFVSEIDTLDTALKDSFADKQGMRCMVFHPAWGYLAHAYGRLQVPIEVEGKAPKPARLKEMIRFAREKGIRVLCVQPQFSAKRAALVAREIGGRVVSADPLAGNWPVNLGAVADQLNAALP
jgi:zinc transport system substrate-binding protein